MLARIAELEGLIAAKVAEQETEKARYEAALKELRKSARGISVELNALRVEHNRLRLEYAESQPSAINRKDATIAVGG